MSRVNAAPECDHMHRLTRRKFCNCMLLTSAGLLVTATDASPVTGSTSGSHLMRIDGAIAMIPGTSILFNYPSERDPAILVRTMENRFFAYSQKCSHLGCSVNFSRDLGCFQCPCHLGAYDLESGNVLHGPPRRGLDQILLQVRGGDVWAVGRSSDYELIAQRTT